MFIIYAIRSAVDGRIYVGMTENVIRRIKEHNTRKVFSTKGYVPWKLVFTEEQNDRITARKREKFYKGGSGKEYLKSMLRARSSMVEQ